MPNYKLQFRNGKRKITVEIETVPGKRNLEFLDEKSLAVLAKKTLPKGVQPVRAQLFWMGETNFYGEKIADIRLSIPKDQTKEEDLPLWRFYAISDYHLFVAWPLIVEHDRPITDEIEEEIEEEDDNEFEE